MNEFFDGVMTGGSFDWKKAVGFTALVWVTSSLREQTKGKKFINVPIKFIDQATGAIAKMLPDDTAE